MKQETQTTTQTRKLGRPRIYKDAMTNKERQQRWRDKVKREAQALLQQVRCSQ